MRGLARDRQRGVAVITALLLTTLAITIIASLFWQQQVQVRSIENQRLQMQKQWMVRATVDFARFVLREDARNSRIDYIGEPWSVPVEDVRLDKYVNDGVADEDASDAILSGYIEDAQGRFNLTNMIGVGGVVKDQVDGFGRLLTARGLDVGLAQATANLMLSAQNAAGGKTDAGFPMRMTSSEDLLAVPGVTPDAFARLKDYVVVLPRATKVNVNTASAEVLSAAIAGISLGDAKAMVASRGQSQYYKDLGDFSNHFQGKNIDTGNLDVQTSYFLVNSNVRLHRASMNIQSLIERNGAATTALWIHEK